MCLPFLATEIYQPLPGMVFAYMLPKTKDLLYQCCWMGEQYCSNVGCMSNSIGPMC